MLKADTPASQLPAAEAPAVSWGAAATATIGTVTVELDEALTTPEWQLSIDTPAFYLRLRIDGPEIITRLHEFLAEDAAGTAKEEFLLGLHGSQNVELLRDDELGRRCFIVIGAGENSSLRLTLGGEQRRQLAKALDDVRDQLRG